MKIQTINTICFNSTAIKKNDNINEQKTNINSLNKNSKNLNVCFPPNYYCSQISFTGRAKASDIIKTIGEDNFPSPEILEKVKELGDSTDFSLYDIHVEHYKDLLECETLDEAKEKYPEFSDVIDAKDIDLNSLGNRNYIIKIAKGEVPGININDLSLELLKKYYGGLHSIRKKEEFWGLSSVDNVCKFLNIKIIDRKYIAIASMQTEEYKKKHSAITKANRQDPNSVYNSPEYAKKMSREMRRRWKDPDSAFNSPDYRRNRSEIMQALHRDPDSAFNSLDYIEKRRRIFESPEYRRRMSDIKKSHWENLESGYHTEEFLDKRAMMAIARSLAWNEHPEISEVMKKLPKIFLCWER